MDGHVAHQQADHLAVHHIDGDSRRASASSPRPSRPITRPANLATNNNAHHYHAHRLAHHRAEYDSHHHYTNHNA